LTFLATPSTDLNLFIQQIENYLDNVVQHGNDQALFISSYLQGHFAVVAGQSQVQQMVRVVQLVQLMEQSLEKAFANNELETTDQKQVLALWQSFITN
jgi:hypothetical protein